MSPRLLYAEVPGFYAEVERASEPALAGRPVIVGGDPRKRGLVQAATADALADGVATGMAVLDALGRCPRARAVRTDMRRYRDAATRLRACLRRVVARLEPAGLGEAYLDASDLPDPSERLAEKLRAGVRDELGLPLRVGAAPAKFLARLAAQEAGPNGLRVVAPADVEAFLAPLPVSRLPGVGPNTEARLRELGAARVGDLVRLGRERVETALGAHGAAVFAAASGQGDTRVRAAPHPRSLSQESTLARDELDRGVLVQTLQALAEGLARGLGLEGLAARRVALKVRYADQEQSTRSRTLAHPAATGAELQEVALELLGRTQAGTRPVRLLGLAVSGLLRPHRDERQLELFRES